MSISNAQACVAKPRSYRLGRRAEKQAETRRRIVEAAVELHCTVGPALTSIAQVAERAGVQRHTFYAHFPDERSLLMACSGLSLERDPLPDPEQWKAAPAGPGRIRRGLGEIYGWYERNAELAACVLRDAEHHPPTRETVELRMTPVFQRSATVLGEGLGRRARALLSVALDFACWRKLRSSNGSAAAAKLMAEAVTALHGDSTRG
jgi:AcrR family transcriptional regulator